jgi:hypothetical protein
MTKEKLAKFEIAVVNAAVDWEEVQDIFHAEKHFQLVKAVRNYRDAVTRYFETSIRGKLS